MKADVRSVFERMDKQTIEQLVMEVKETLALELDFSKKQPLKVVDIWTMEKNRKSASERFSNKRNFIPFI